MKHKSTATLIPALLKALDTATKAELVTVTREPARRLLAVITGRARQLKEIDDAVKFEIEQTKEMKRIIEVQVEANPNWGEF